MPLDLNYFKKSLKSRHDELSAIINTETEETRKPVELDQTKQGRLSRMDAMQVQAMGKATDHRRIIELKQIETALIRIENGDYGICISCEENISEARLKANPAALTCINCA